MRVLTFITATAVAAGLAHRLHEITWLQTGMCAAIGMGAGIVVLVLCKPDNLKGVA